MSIRRLASVYHVWWKLAVCLGLFTAWVQWVFVPRWLVPRYAAEGPILHDSSGGRNVASLFARLPVRRAPGAVRVVIVGDSSVAAQKP